MSEFQLQIPIIKSNNFQWMNADAYLFDIDGTLLHAHGGVHTGSFSLSVQAVMGHPLPIDSVPVHGNTDIGILRAALTHHGKLSDCLLYTSPSPRDS